MDPLQTLTARVTCDSDNLRAPGKRFHVETSFGLALELTLSGRHGSDHVLSISSPCCQSPLVPCNTRWFNTGDLRVECVGCKKIAPDFLNARSGAFTVQCPARGVFADVTRITAEAVAKLTLDPLMATLAVDALERSFGAFVRMHSRDLAGGKTEGFPVALPLTAEAALRRG